jgi:L-glyceraldehyde 3-phosphate reductase
MTYVANEDRYSQMKYRRTGKSGLLLPEISFGLWHSYGDIDDQTVARDMLRRAFDLGVTHFDLANNYGPPYGSAETNFGKLFKQDWEPYRDQLIISTKAGYDMWPGPYGEWGSRKYLTASLDQSLKRMGLDYVDVFYSHRFDPNTPLEETMGALASAVQQGKALYVGISSYDSQNTRKAQEILASMGVPLLIHQPRYNMFDRGAENGLLDTIGATGIGSIVFSPLAQGLLTNKYLKGIPSDSRAARDFYLKADGINQEYVSRVEGLSKIAAERGQNLAQLALSWVLRHPQVTSALIGASSVKQLEECIAAVKGPSLTQAELTAIDEFAVNGTGAY